MIIVLDVIVDVYGEPNSKTGLPKLLKKGAIYKKSFDTSLIYPEEYINKRGTIVKKYTGLEYGEKYYVVAHSMTYINKLINPIVIKGLASKVKKTK